MEKETKNPLTRTDVERTLRGSIAWDLRLYLTLFLVMLGVFVPLGVISVRMMMSLPDPLAFKIILSVVVGGMMSMPIAVMLFYLCPVLMGLRKLLRGEFEIVLLQVTCKREKAGPRNSIRRVLEFDGFRDYCVGYTEYQLATEGDEYYVIHYRGSRSVQTAYSAKRYEYRP